MDPMDHYAREESVDPAVQYECLHCGARFGDECVSWSEEEGKPIAVCPECGLQAVVGD